MRPGFVENPGPDGGRNNALTHAPMQFKFETMAPLYQTVALFRFPQNEKAALPSGRFGDGWN